jgi:hypothetical protein
MREINGHVPNDIFKSYEREHEYEHQCSFIILATNHEKVHEYIVSMFFFVDFTLSFLG